MKSANNHCSKKCCPVSTKGKGCAGTPFNPAKNRQKLAKIGISI